MNKADFEKHIKHLFPDKDFRVDTKLPEGGEGFILRDEDSYQLGGMAAWRGGRWSVWTKEYDSGGPDEPSYWWDKPVGVFPHYWKALAELATALRARDIRFAVARIEEV